VVKVRAAARLAWSLWSGAALILALAVGLAPLGRSDLGGLVVSGSFASVGALLASRRADNPIGWLFCGFGLTIALDLFARQYAAHALVTDPGSLPGGQWMAWVSDLAVALSFGPFIFLFLLFPQGHLLSRRWRPAAWLVGASSLVEVVVSALWSVRMSMNLPSVEPPIRMPGYAVARHVYEINGNLIGLIIIASALSVMVRQRRATGDERQQLKWFTYAVVCVMVALLFAAAANRNADLVLYVTPVIPIAAGIAVLKYRLYDIDVIINRTLVYGALSAILALAYAAVVTAASSLAGQSDLTIAGATLAVAALFRPLRGRLQAFIDQRFYRRKYDAARTLEAFSAQLKNEVDLEALTRDLVTVVQDTMQPTQTWLWLKR
jgi:hypothetical protein